jgi:hypothetical protein
MKQFNREIVDRTIGRLALMKFFPASDVVARATVMAELMEMCANDEQVEWIGKRMSALYTEWPGLRELRAVFCSKFKPRDGIEVNSTDARFIDGIPSERGLSAPESQSQRALTGHATLQIAGKVEKMPAEDLEQLHTETIGAVLEAHPTLQPDRRDWIAAKRLAAILDGRGEEAARLTSQLNALNPRTREEREAIREAERQIAEAKPTLTAEEKSRRIAEIEAALPKPA